MNDPRYATYPAGINPPRKAPAPSVLTMGGIGLIIGAAGSAAANIRRVNNGDIDKGQALRNVSRDAAGTSLATVAATAAVNVLGLSGLFSAAGMLAAATATKYLYDSAVELPARPAPVQAPPGSKTKSKASARKTAKPSAGKSAKTTAKKSAKKSAKTTDKKEV